MEQSNVKCNSIPQKILRSSFDKGRDMEPDAWKDSIWDITIIRLQ